MQTFTRDALAAYNGQNRQPAYVAVSGTVYDVTNIEPWKGGHHHGLTAGIDATEAIQHSPHGVGALAKAPKVGQLVD